MFLVCLTLALACPPHPWLCWFEGSDRPLAAGLAGATCGTSTLPLTKASRSRRSEEDCFDCGAWVHLFDYHSLTETGSGALEGIHFLSKAKTLFQGTFENGVLGLNLDLPQAISLRSLHLLPSAAGAW